SSGVSVVVFPTSRPPRTARPEIPLKASHPNVAAFLSAFSAFSTFSAGRSNRHSVRGGGGDGATRAETSSGLYRSVSRSVTGPARGRDVQPAARQRAITAKARRAGCIRSPLEEGCADSTLGAWTRRYRDTL